MNWKNVKTSIIIPTFNNLDILKQTIQTLRDSSKDVNYDIIVVDDGSTDNTVDYLKSQKDIISIIHDKNYRNAKVWNSGIKKAIELNSDFICISNDDVLFAKDWLKNIVIAAIENLDYFVFRPAITLGRILKDGEMPPEKPSSYINAYGYTTLEKIQKNREKLLQQPITIETSEETYVLFFPKKVFDIFGLLDETIGYYSNDHEFVWRICYVTKTKILGVQNSFVHHLGAMATERAQVNVRETGDFSGHEMDKRIADPEKYYKQYINNYKKYLRKHICVVQS